VEVAGLFYLKFCTASTFGNPNGGWVDFMVDY
jgi:hypothetical protein